MARHVEPPGGGIATRILLGIVVLAVVWILLQVVLGMVFAVVRGALLLVLFGIVAWVVLVGPPGGRD
jgi:hypothetical protein